MSKKKIAIIGTVGLPANYGGFETLADHLVKNLAGQYDITVYCSGQKYPRRQRQKNYHGGRLVYLPFDANGIQSIIYDTISIVHSLFYADVLLVLGVAGAWTFPLVKFFTNKKIIVSIDGIEWKRDKWNMLARIYLWWAEKIAVKYSHIDISDNESIQDYTAMRYGSLSRIIEYGADHTIKVEARTAERLQYPFMKNPYAFKVCRIEPENNVHVILETFAGLPRHTLVVVGNWNKNLYGIELRERYANCQNIFMLDPIYNQRSLDLLRSNALVYIHGHSAGGTNPSLVEAMYLGLPVIAFDVSYNRTTTENKAIYFKKTEDLNRLLLSSSVARLQELGAEMKQIAQRRYTWVKITNSYARLVREALAAEKKISVRGTPASIGHSQLIEIEAAHLNHHNLFFDKR
jgi:glycosyltransferase involved in cell wall biosynthesis